jgi:hypothetical protein
MSGNLSFVRSTLCHPHYNLKPKFIIHKLAYVLGSQLDADPARNPD